MGTAAEALLELYNPELLEFGGTLFRVGAFQPSTRTPLHSDTQGTAGDPASLGVSAIILVPRWSNGAIPHRPDIAKIWADNMAMSFPFLAYLAVETGNSSLMAETVTKCGLQRAPQDEGLWSAGSGWAGYGMVRVLHTLQKWSGSASMTAQATQLKGWIEEILDGSMLLGFDDGLLRNCLNDVSWFEAVARHQGPNRILSPTVNPYAWLDRNKCATGSPEAQAFAVYLYTAYRDCV
ncbi:hypothetical protein OQA88_5245 [Cercophora sp. LCS_1]